jgi:aminoglycoside phosphotransferase (APT) family kinase protein
MELLYQRPTDQIPCPLPNKEDIEHAAISLSTRETYGRKIVRVGQHIVVKYGKLVRENEGHVLLFLEKNSLTQAPLLYAMYRDSDKLYIVMQYLPGEDLRSLWPQLNNDEKISITAMIREVFDKMRSVQPPEYFGSVKETGVPHPYFYSKEHDQTLTGPFERESDLNAAMAKRCMMIREENTRRDWLPAFFERHLPSSLQNHCPTFTHSDFHRENVIISQSPADDGSARQFHVRGIVDWELAGWYPSYWEYAACFVSFLWNDVDWPEYVDMILDPWPKEACVLKAIRTYLEF